ncbi:hypothetical protein B0H10DRAFT_42545 [Mycena sp. CBHHK59/15]|nr:hypothetical protein B0H10DRAFT_42545 [Mycena sp. CBHHK59/15]
MLHARFCLPLFDRASVFCSTQAPPLRHGCDTRCSLCFQLSRETRSSDSLQSPSPAPVPDRPARSLGGFLRAVGIYFSQNSSLYPPCPTRLRGLKASW